MKSGGFPAVAAFLAAAALAVAARFGLRLRGRLRAIDRRIDRVERLRRVEHLADLVRSGEEAGRLDAASAERFHAWLDETRGEIESAESEA